MIWLVCRHGSRFAIREPARSFAGGWLPVLLTEANAAYQKLNATPLTTVYTRFDYDPNILGAGSAGEECVVFSGQVATPTNPSSISATTFVGRLMYFFDNIPLNTSKTVKVVYERF